MLSRAGHSHLHTHARARARALCLSCMNTAVQTSAQTYEHKHIVNRGSSTNTHVSQSAAQRGSGVGKRHESPRPLSTSAADRCLLVAPTKRRKMQGGYKGAMPVEQVNTKTGEVVGWHVSLSTACRKAKVAKSTLWRLIRDGLVHQDCLWR